MLDSSMTLISVVVPTHNEVPNIEPLYERLKAVFTKGNRIAPGGVAFHFATLALAKFHPLGH